MPAFAGPARPLLRARSPRPLVISQRRMPSHSPPLRSSKPPSYSSDPPRARSLFNLPPSSLPARAPQAVPLRSPGSPRPQSSRGGQVLFVSQSLRSSVLGSVLPVTSSLGRHGGSPAPPAAPPSGLSENRRSSASRLSATASPNPGMQRTRGASRRSPLTLRLYGLGASVLAMTLQELRVPCRAVRSFDVPAGWTAAPGGTAKALAVFSFFRTSSPP